MFDLLDAFVKFNLYLDLLPCYDYHLLPILIQINHLVAPQEDSYSANSKPRTMNQ
jgi:hypothetical protein